MKVLYLIDSLEGYGAERSLIEITTRFKKIKPVFVHIYEGDQLKTKLEENGIKVYSLNLTGKYNLQCAEKLILTIIEKEKPALIHSTLFRSDIIARRIKRKRPQILLVGSLVNNSYSPYRKREMNFIQRIKHKIIEKWDRRTSKYVDYFISNSEAIVKPNIQALNINIERIKVIHRGRDLSRFIQHDRNFKPRNLRKNYSNVFLNISRLENRKGQKDLIVAFSIFLKLHPQSILLLVGEGPARNDIKDLIIQMNLKNSVHLLGYRQDIPQLLAFSDFFVFPTYFEGLPGALIEAAISKTPIIASNIPENRECLAPECALLFSPGNISELVGKLEKAISLTEWERKTEGAYNYAKAKFDIRIISKEYENFYFQIFGKL